MATVACQRPRLLNTSGARYLRNSISDFSYFKGPRDKGGRFDDVAKCVNVERGKAFSAFCR